MASLPPPGMTFLVNRHVWVSGHKMILKGSVSKGAIIWTSAAVLNYDETQSSLYRFCPRQRQVGSFWWPVDFMDFGFGLIYVFILVVTWARQGALAELDLSNLRPRKHHPPSGAAIPPRLSRRGSFRCWTARARTPLPRRGICTVIPPHSA